MSPLLLYCSCCTRPSSAPVRRRLRKRAPRPMNVCAVLLYILAISAALPHGLEMSRVVPAETQQGLRPILHPIGCPFCLNRFKFPAIFPPLCATSHFSRYVSATPHFYYALLTFESPSTGWRTHGLLYKVQWLISP